VHPALIASLAAAGLVRLAVLIGGGFVGFLLGGVFASALLVSRRTGRKQPIPFGPS
jgi:hypothetical protein